MQNNETQSATTEEQINILLQNIQTKPYDIKNYFELGLLLKTIGQFEDAKTCYHRILEVLPTDIDTLFDMAFACQHLGQLDDAIKWYEKLFQIDPKHAQAHINIGHIYRIQGQVQQACHHFMHAESTMKHDGLEVLRYFSLPVLYHSKDEIMFYRQRLNEYVTNNQVNLSDPFKQVGITQFLLAYHGLDDTMIQKSIADFYYRSCPSLNYFSPHLNQTKSKNRISIGFASTFFWEKHPVGKVFQGLIKYLNPEKFRIVLFHTSCKAFVQSKVHERHKEKIKYLPRDLSKSRDIIANEKLDILFYPEIGMDPLIYFLAFSRLANVQCVGWGHPVTSGIQNIDYYISTIDMEPDNGMMHYTEKLVMLQTFISFFYRPQKITQHLKRSDFHIPDGHWYVCPQNIQKMHPDMDTIFSEILINDPKGILVLYAGKYPVLTQQLKNRIKKSMPKLINRIIFVNSMPFEKFLQFLNLCDAVLDVPYFSSGTTTLEAFSMGIPIVTMPGNFFRNRLAYGCFKRINVFDTIAKNLNHYVTLANQLACDKDFKRNVSNNILTNIDVLFDNQEVIRAYEQFFIHISQ